MEIFKDPKRILIIKLGIGGVMMAEGVMRCIRQHYPDAHYPATDRFMRGLWHPFR